MSLGSSYLSLLLVLLHIREWALRAEILLKEYGCIEVMDALKDHLPIGEHTDFRRAVNAKEDEKIVFSWQKWPDKQAVDTIEKTMSEDPRFDPPQGIPFDQSRLIMGCFVPISEEQAN